MPQQSNNELYKVELYHLLGTSYTFTKSMCDVEPLGKIIVSVSKKCNSKTNERIGECREVLEDFNIPLVDCGKSSRYDGWYDEHITEFSLPYEYNYWNKHKNYIICSEEIKESNLATPKDLKEYNPEQEVWYKLLKEIQTKGIDFDYEQEAINEIIYGKKQLRKGTKDE